MGKKKAYDAYDEIDCYFAPTVEDYKKKIGEKNYKSVYGYYPINRADWFVRGLCVKGGKDGKELLKQQLIEAGFFSKFRCFNC